MVAIINKSIFTTSNEEKYRDFLGEMIAQESINQINNYSGVNYPEEVYINRFLTFDNPNVKYMAAVNVEGTTYDESSNNQTITSATTTYFIDCHYIHTIENTNVNYYDSLAMVNLTRLTHNVRSIIMSTYYYNLQDENVKKRNVTNVSYFPPETRNTSSQIIASSRLTFQVEYFEDLVQGVVEDLEEIRTSIFVNNEGLVILKNTI